MEKSSDVKLINDSVYGLIKLPQYILAIVDTPQFQRLRWLSQIGVSYFVYPTATHSRFEHSIGTYHIASKLIRNIKCQLDESTEIDAPKVSDDDVMCIEIAALCHDLGHGPFSHWWDAIFTPKVCPSEHYKSHDELSAEILYSIIHNESKAKTILNLWGITEEKANFISQLIRGYGENVPKNRQFMFEIVSNKQSGLDVDKFDYLSRDMIYLGQSMTSYRLEVFRFLYFFKVKSDQDGNWHLTMRDKEFIHVHKVFYLRHVLHRIVCHNKTTKSIEIMLCDAYAEGKLRHQENSKTNNFNQSILDLIFDQDNLCKTDLILLLNDQYFWQLINMNNTNTILNRILTRDLYRLFKIYVKTDCKLRLEDLSKTKLIKNRTIDVGDVMKSDEWRNYFLDKSPRELFQTFLEDEIDLKLKDYVQLRKNMFSILQKDLERIVNVERNVIRTSVMEFSLGSDGSNPLYQVYFYKKSGKGIFRFNENNLPNAATHLRENEIEIQIFLISKEKLSEEMSEELSKIISQWTNKYKFFEQDFI